MVPSSWRQPVMRVETAMGIRCAARAQHSERNMHEAEDGGAASPSAAARIVAAKSVDVAAAAEVEGAKKRASKLCGYLNKLSGKGPLRGYKPGWFVYDPRKCYLYYFKTPQDALPLGHIEIGDACFSYDVEGEEGQFEIRTTGKEFLMKAPTRQVMHFWLQQLQQKRWEYSNTQGSSWSSLTLASPPTGLVGKDNYAPVFPKLSDGMEKVRSDFAMETESDGGGMVGIQSARGPSAASTNPLNFSLKNFGTELRNSMSYLRLGRGAESRRSMFYANSSAEEWELVDAPTKDFPEQQKHHTDTHRHSFGSAFHFDFARNASRPKKPLLRDMMASGRFGRSTETRSAESPPVECNGSRPLDAAFRLQSQQEELGRMQREQADLRGELASQKELVRLLQQTLRTSQCDRQPVSRPAPDSSAASDHTPGLAGTQQENGQLEALLQERDGQVQDLCGHMERLALEKESLQQELKGLKIKVGDINDQLGMLMETIQAKDEVIIKLSQESSEQSAIQSDGSPLPVKDQEEMDILKDSLQGYKSQNKFLNKEILELTVLRRNAESREKVLEAKCTALEAKLCQVESKYLVLLQELKNPICSFSEQSPAREVISRLLEDALQAESSDHPDFPIFKPNTVSEYDTFGFKTVPEEEEEEERLVAKVRALELKSLSMTDQEVSIGVKWENYLSSTMNRDLVRSPEIKALFRYGVPHEHRSQVWHWCVSFHVKKFRDNLAPDYYETLLNVARDKPNPASKQIELDLLRTLPNNKHYSSPSADGIQKLRNVLMAFSWRNPDIGYCQGLNRLAAIALLYLEQEDAFWSLIAIVEVFMPRDYYTKTLLGSQVDQRVFKDLMCEKLPRLHAHFEQYKVDFSLITFNWFLVVFVDSVVSDILFKIWDSFLYEGPKIIFRFALALFKYKEEEFLKLEDSTAIFKYLRCFTRTILDSRKLMNISFGDMNPFPMRQIQNRRSFHLEKVRLELTELEAIRQTFLRERETCQKRRSFVSDDEEDN
ncbi:TBC1 domain family member 2B-like [Gasterosteus aculeatus]|uniref:TBC1 domain family, member 2B n=1 Tax=Gasterosteus aculeatus aculeatus TaxID=481459 RepID=A0AAQ4R491_GASAC|nr:TBC1 domain family member 2B-like [Gasterosteus aculeatus aculeatus]XP_040024719.1 TBC1 domain family member 2B-like [Gasterosteus aculeatus aculeatus]